VLAVFNTYGQQPSPVTGIVYHYLTRYPPNANHIADAEYDCPWQVCVAIHGLLLHHRETGSAQSIQVALDATQYLVDYAWNGVAMNEALDVDDHTHANWNLQNSGTNTWVPSALALASRYGAGSQPLAIATAMYDSIPSLTPWNISNGWGIYHWWHSYRAELLGL
jgi:hypothetical protein